MDITEVIRTTFAARQFTDDPVPDEVIERMIEHARFAPSGGNRQGWHVIVVRDPEIRAAIAAAAERPAKRYMAMQQAGEGPWNAAFPSSVTDESAASMPTPRRLMDPYIEAPVCWRSAWTSASSPRSTRNWIASASSQAAPSTPSSGASC